LRQVVNTVNTFIDVDECIDFITDIKEEKTLMMVSGTLSQIILPIIQDIAEVSSVYIFCAHETRHESWEKQSTKAKFLVGCYSILSCLSTMIHVQERDYVYVFLFCFVTSLFLLWFY
jgi:hypothetical protein